MKHPIVINSRGVIRQERQTIYANITWDTRFLKLPNDYKDLIDGYLFWFLK